MSNAISETISLRPYSTTVKSGTAQRSGANSGFLDLLAQTKKAQVDMVSFSGGISSVSGLTMDLAAVYSSTEGQMNVENVAGTEAVSLESMLKAKYPGLTYHVLDQSTSCWRTRNDYPHYLLYQEGEAAEEKLKNWKPEGANPFYGSIDGRFTAPQSIHALGSLPPGSKAVAIHPKVQERMEQDPEYAKEIFARIDAWFTLDVARNEAIMPGSTWDMSQAVAIGEDGNICTPVHPVPARSRSATAGATDRVGGNAV